MINLTKQPKKFKFGPKKRSVHSLFPTTQQPRSSNTFAAPENLPLAKLIKLEEGILAYKVSSDQGLRGNFFTDIPLDRHYRLLNYTDQEYHNMQQRKASNSSATELLKPAITYHYYY